MYLFFKQTENRQKLEHFMSKFKLFKLLGKLRMILFLHSSFLHYKKEFTGWFDINSTKINRVTAKKSCCVTNCAPPKPLGVK